MIVARQPVTRGVVLKPPLPVPDFGEAQAAAHGTGPVAGLYQRRIRDNAVLTIS